VFDPQTLPGVSPKLAAAMIAAGFDSREAILAGDLTTVKGIGEGKADAIKAALQAPVEVRDVLEELQRALG